jgi:uncharacterized protein (TIGR03382 family)
VTSDNNAANDDATAAVSVGTRPPLDSAAPDDEGCDCAGAQAVWAILAAVALLRRRVR